MGQSCRNKNLTATWVKRDSSVGGDLTGMFRIRGIIRMLEERYLVGKDPRRGDEETRRIEKE